MLKILFAMLALFLAPVAMSEARASQTWIVIGDSIDGYVPGGEANDLYWHLISANRDVIFRNVSTPGAQLGATFAGQNIIDTINGICGYGAPACNGLIISAGRNDHAYGTSWAAYVNALNALIAWADSHDKKIILLDLVWGGTSAESGAINAAGKTFSDYRTHRYFMQLSHSGTVYFFGRPSAFNVSTPSLWTSNHPNVAGHLALRTWVQSQAATAGLF